MEALKKDAQKIGALEKEQHSTRLSPCLDRESAGIVHACVSGDQHKHLSHEEKKREVLKELLLVLKSTTRLKHELRKRSAHKQNSGKERVEPQESVRSFHLNFSK